MEDEKEYTEEEIRAMEAIQRISSSLLKKRDEAVKFRAASGVERRWREDEEAYDIGVETEAGASMMDYATGTAPTKEKGPTRSKVIVNIVRGKCDIATQRFSDIQLPTDDKNYGLEITPIPELAEAIKDDRQARLKGDSTPLEKDGKPITISDVARKELEVAKEKMKAMETAIDDQLTECRYNAEQRKLIASAVKVGTGILKGPNIIKDVRKKWIKTENGHELQVKEDTQPASKWVSCWNVYPSPECGEDIRRASYIWERDTLLPRELRDLHGVDGYFDDQIVKVLKEEPKRTKVAHNAKSNRHRVEQSTLESGELYEEWIYSGSLNREDLEALGVDLGDDMITQSFSAVVVFVNDRPIKVQLNTLDTGELPYDFFQWTEVTDSPWGIGVARVLIWLQRIIIGAWRATMDNAGDSSGANVIVGPGIEPVDGKWELRGKKLWRVLTGDGNEDIDVRKAFSQFQILNNQAQLEAVINLALKFVDMETALPMLFQGEQQEAPKTLGATNIMVDSSNIALRGRVKLYDDKITSPHITRYYDWNMQYNDDDEIKGDYKVDPRGASVLFEKDQHAQTLMQIMAMKNDPDFALKVDWEKAVDQALSSLRLDIAKDPEAYKEAKKQYEAAQKNGQQQDPSIAIAKLREEAELKKAEITADTAEKERVFKADEADRDRQFKYAIEEMKMNTKMMELAQVKGISIDKIKSELMRDSMKLKLQKDLAGPDKRGPQVITPPVEPEGRALPGRAYQD